MKNIMTLYKADPITDDKPVEDVEIHIFRILPHGEEFRSLREVKEFYHVDALNLFHVLKNHLPQGTRHQLMILLLQDTENLYRGT